MSYLWWMSVEPDAKVLSLSSNINSMEVVNILRIRLCLIPDVLTEWKCFINDCLCLCGAGVTLKKCVQTFWPKSRPPCKVYWIKRVSTQGSWPLSRFWLMNLIKWGVCVSVCLFSWVCLSSWVWLWVSEGALLTCAFVPEQTWRMRTYMQWKLWVEPPESLRSKSESANSSERSWARL